MKILHVHTYDPFGNHFLILDIIRSLEVSDFVDVQSLFFAYGIFQL